MDTFTVLKPVAGDSACTTVENLRNLLLTSFTPDIRDGKRIHSRTSF
jgi:hypothetical protein